MQYFITLYDGNSDIMVSIVPRKENAILLSCLFNNKMVDKSDNRHFRVWEQNNNKDFNKEKSILIYPSEILPLSIKP